MPRNYNADQILYYIDVAISAPFSETGSSDPGTVYIYHSVSSMLLICNEPQQVHVVHV